MLNPITIFTIELKCRFCGIKLGEHKLSSEFGWTAEIATAEKMGYVDSRCSTHQVEFGSYKENEALYEKNKLGTPQDYEVLAKTKPKSSDIIEEINKKK